MTIPGYLHKGLTNVDAEALLTETGVRGAYLVRDSETLPGAYVLCLWSGERVNRYRILLNDDGLLALTVGEGKQERHFGTLDALIQYYISLGEKNGLAAPLKLPVYTSSHTDNPAEFDGDVITKFFQHRQTELDLSIVDGAFIEELKSYIDEHVGEDAATAVQTSCPEYARPHQPPVIPAPLHETVPHLHYLLDRASLSLQRELQLYLKKLDLIGCLFTPRDQELRTMIGGGVSAGNLECLLDQMATCRSSVDHVLMKARDTLKDMSANRRDVACTVDRMENERKISQSNILHGLPKYVPPTVFEVKTYRGNLSQLKTVHLSVDLQTGSISELVPGQESTPVVLLHDKIDQVIKSQVNSAMVEMKVDGAKKKKVLMFKDVRGREKFCQLIQTMKDLHRDNDQQLDAISVFVGSWNMGDEAPRDNLSAWLRCQGDGKNLDESIAMIPHDIYVIGTQESALSEKEWSNRVKKTLFNMYHINFQTVVVESLWGIRLVVLCNPLHVNKISHVDVANVKTGIANALGNKGAVGVSFDINATSVCFICCHLAARGENAHKRNQNYRDIVRGMTLGDRRFSLFDLTTRFHHIIWFGDLNYRLDEEIDVVLQHVNNNTYLSLLNKDQLHHAQHEKLAFNDFCEECVTFRPTYRYEKGSKDIYAWRKVKKTTVRINVPSWCDRILWKSFPGTYVENLAYGCQNEIMSSDHRPVFASLRLGVIQQFAAKMTDRQEEVVIIFQCCEAEVKTPVRQNFCLEFHSTCLEAPVTSLVSCTNQNIGLCSSSHAPASSANQSDHTSVTCNVKWLRQSIPKLTPICADRDFLEDQFLLVIVKSPETNESFGECVLDLKSHISVTPQYFESYLSHQAEYTGSLRGEMHVRSSSSDVNLNTRRRTVRTYECVRVGVLNPATHETEADGRLDARPRSDCDLHKRSPTNVTNSPRQCASSGYEDLSSYSSVASHAPPPIPARNESLSLGVNNTDTTPTTGVRALIADWLNSLGLAQYQTAFLNYYKIDSMYSLDDLDESKLLLLGVHSSAHRRTILDSLTKVKRGYNTMPANTGRRGHVRTNVMDLFRQ